MMQLNEKSFALLIGVGDYRAFDASGNADLDAAPYDVRSMYALARELDVPRENIHVLVSPKGGKGADPTALMSDILARGQGVDDKVSMPASVALATAANVRKELRWLASQLQSADCTGLVTWSGHGALVADHLCVCPSDVAPDLGGAISFPEIQQIFVAAGAHMDGLTAILDCCHAGMAGAGVGGKRVTTLTPDAPAKVSPMVHFAGRMVTACKPGELACQSTFDDVTHGALTWALKTANDQWKVNVKADAAGKLAVGSSAAGRDLKGAAQKLLTALQFEQHIELIGPRGAAGLAFFAPPASGLATSKTMDRPRGHVQLEPDALYDYTLYTFSVTYGTAAPVVVAKAYSVNPDNSQHPVPEWVKDASGKQALNGYEYAQTYGTWPPPSSLNGKSASALAVTGERHNWSESTSNPLAATAQLGASFVAWNYSPDLPSGLAFFYDNRPNGIAAGVGFGGTSSAPELVWAIFAYGQPEPGTYAVTNTTGSTPFNTTEPTSGNWYLAG